MPVLRCLVFWAAPCLVVAEVLPHNSDRPSMSLYAGTQMHQSCNQVTHTACVQKHTAAPKDTYYNQEYRQTVAVYLLLSGRQGNVSTSTPHTGLNVWTPLVRNHSVAMSQQTLPGLAPTGELSGWHTGACMAAGTLRSKQESNMGLYFPMTDL